MADIFDSAHSKMEQRRGAGRLSDLGQQVRAFLDDALLQHPTPSVLLVGDQETTDRYAGLISHDGVPGWIPAPTNDSWVTFSAGEAVARGAAYVTSLRSGLPAVDSWLYVSGLDACIGSEPGKQLLDVLCDVVAAGSLPCVLSSITAVGFDRLSSSQPRWLGLSRFLELNTDSPNLAELAYVVVQSGVTGDTGWLVMVRCVLQSPAIEHGRLPGDPRTDAALRLTDSIGMQGLLDGTFGGVQVSFKPHAFTVGQQAAAFSSAELVARRAIGRELVPGESVEAARGVIYV